jgi:threonine dehydrogenase-like Zn-dependent dehydrogenase
VRTYIPGLLWRLGADRIIALSRNPARQELARSFGANEILAERGDGATEAVLELTDGVGVDAALECVGTAQSFATSFAIARPEGRGHRHSYPGGACRSCGLRLWSSSL